MFEQIAPVRRVADRLVDGSAQIAEGLALHHLILRAQVAEVFADELQKMAWRRHDTALDAIDVAASWETWDQLRRTKGLSASASARVVSRLVEGALGE